MTLNLGNLDCRYFISYSGVSLPLKLVNPLTEAGLENRNTFFRAYYNDLEQILVCQKLVYGEIELDHRYHYYANGSLKQAEITDADGELTILDFEETEV